MKNQQGVSMAVKISTMRNMEIAVLEVRGTIIGGDETDELKKEANNLLEQGNRKLIVDMSGVTYINSSGLGAMVSIHGSYAKADGRICLCGMGKSVKNVFVLTRLTSIFDVEDTKEEALARFS
jgi:anti-sigma B factor antagonist